VGGQGALTEEEASGTGHDVEAAEQRRWAYGIVVVVDGGRESNDWGNIEGKGYR
jgi:hypothetical protein